MASIYDQKHPITDVVVLTYNNWKLSETCFQHILKNTVDFNLIVVDNGSSDDTVANVKKLQKKHTNIILIENNENKGVAGGRNIGAQASNAEFILNLDNDQIPSEKFWLEEYYSIIEKCNVSMVGAEGWEMNSPSSLKPYFPRKHCQIKFDKPSYIGGGGTIFSRQAFDKLGGFDEAYNPCYFEDPDFSFNLQKNNMKAMWHYQAKIRHIGHQTIGKQREYSPNVQFQKSYKYFVKKWNPYFPTPIDVLLLERWLPEVFKYNRR